MNQRRMRRQSKADKAVLNKQEIERCGAGAAHPGPRRHRTDGSRPRCTPESHSSQVAGLTPCQPPTPAPYGRCGAVACCAGSGGCSVLCRREVPLRKNIRRGASARKGRSLRREKLHPAQRGCDSETEAEKSQYQYLININIHDKWLKMAIVSKVLSWACNVEEPDSLSYSMELRRFEYFDLFTLVFASSYLKRVATAHILDFPTFSTLFLVCNIIALKYQEDYNTMNCRYSERWGLQLMNINAIEAEVLLRLNYDLTVKYSEIISILDERIYYLKRLRLC